MSDFEGLIKQIKVWAAARPGLRAVVIVGSQARVQPPADEYSDLDLVLFCREAQAYAANSDWLEPMGTPWLAVRGATGWGDLEWVIVFAGGAKVDFVFASLAEELQSAPLMAILQSSPYGFVYHRGVRVLVDLEHPEDEDRFLSFPRQPQSDPTEGEFSQTVQQFFLQALRSARFLCRGELWRAARLINGDLKFPYLTMLEWHTRSVHQPAPDTWYDGHFLAEWADPRAVRELPWQFAACEQGVLWEALFASLESFRWIGKETAGQLGWSYPENLDAQISGEIQSLHATIMPGGV